MATSTKTAAAAKKAAAAKTTTSAPAKKASTSHISAAHNNAKRITGRRHADELISAALSAGWNDDASIIIDGKMLVFAEEAAHIVTLTPEDATQLLARNFKNRTVKVTPVNKLVTDIMNGDFSFNGASVVLSPAGRVLDGQHRLLACSTAGKPIRTVIVTGVEDETQSDMDSGTARSFADYLRMQGETDVLQLAATVFGIQEYILGDRGGKTVSKGKVTNSTSKVFLNENPDMRDLCHEAYLTAKRIPGLTGKQISQMIWAFDRLGDDECVNDRKVFFQKLISGVGLDEGSPILALRNLLQKELKSKTKYDDSYRFALACKAWNAYRESRTMAQLSIRGGANPESFPEPI